MKISYLLALLLIAWVSSFTGFTQMPNNDVIVKIDNARIPCRMVAIGVDSIFYRNVTGRTINRISKASVQKVFYANGSVIVIPVRAKIPGNSKPEMLSEPSQQSKLDRILSDFEDGKSVTNQKIRLRILFEVGSEKIQPQSFAYLDSIALFLAKTPTLMVEISGFTDNTGNASDNLRLSQNRANEVRGYLTNILNVPITQIKAVGYGQAEPIATNNTDSGRALNRRVELKFLGLSNEVYTLQFKNDQRLNVTFIASSADHQTLSYKENVTGPLEKVPVSQVQFIEYPDGTRRRVGSTEVIKNEVEVTPIEDTPSRVNDKQNSKSLSPTTPKTSFQLNFIPTYMLGEKFYTSLDEGYGHTIGLGGSAQFDYWLAKRISIGAEGGYLTWRTNVAVVENRGEQPYRTYSTQTDQIFLLSHIGVRVGKHFYLMPQGGINLLNIKVKDAVTTDVFKSYQISYGGAIGYLLDISHAVKLNAGLFYRNSMSTKTAGAPDGFDAIQYVGFRLGLQLSR